MKTAENIKKIALVFFFILGSVHILSGLMTANDYFMPASLVLNRVLDIPFAMSAVIYGFASIYVKMAPGKHKAANIAFSVISILILVLLLYINLLTPDKPSLVS